MRWAGRARIAATVVSLLALAPSAHAAYRMSQPLSLDAGQSGTFTLACREGDVATDGTWSVDTVGVDVIEADGFSRQGYRFVVRNSTAGAAPMRLFVSCLEGRRGLRVRAARGGDQAVRCPAGTVAIAPGFRTAGGAGARLLTRFPRSALAVLRTEAEGAALTTSARCLRRRGLGPIALRAGVTTVGAGRVESYSVSCRRGETALVGAFRLKGALYLGQTPLGRRRSFRLQAPAGGASGSARLGLVCLRGR
jgi:hypothetical protein